MGQSLLFRDFIVSLIEKIVPNEYLATKAPSLILR